MKLKGRAIADVTGVWTGRSVRGDLTGFPCCLCRDSVVTTSGLWLLGAIKVANDPSYEDSDA